MLNNASALDLRTTREIGMKQYDLMQDINARGTFLLSKASIPLLERSDNAHVLTLSPPLDLRPQWAGSYLAYTMAKYGMSLVTLGLAEELREAGIAVNSLWPRTTIATAAVRNLLEFAGVAIDAIDFFVFHQANKMINETIRKKLGLAAEKVPSTLHDFGNTSGASMVSSARCEQPTRSPACNASSTNAVPGATT